MPDDMPTRTKREWWTPKELAEHWRLSVSTIHRMHTGDPENFGRVMSGSLRIHNSHVERVENLNLNRRRKSDLAG